MRPPERRRAPYLIGLAIFIVTMLAAGAFAISLLIEGSPSYPMRVTGTADAGGDRDGAQLRPAGDVALARGELGIDLDALEALLRTRETPAAAAAADAVLDSVAALLAPSERTLLAAARQWTADEQHARAVAAYDRLVSGNPDNFALLAEQANVLSWAGEHARAAELFARIAQRTDALTAAQSAARNYWWAGDAVAADAWLERVLERVPGDTAAARMQREVRLAASPSVALAESWARNGGTLEQLVLARTLVRDSRYAEAIGAYRDALATGAADSAYLELAAAASAADSTDARIAALEAYHARGHDTDETKLALARAYAWSGRYADALTIYDTLDPAADEGVAVERAQVLLWSGDLEQSRVVLERIVARDTANALALKLLGDAVTWQGDAPAALAHYRAAAALEPGLPGLVTAYEAAEEQARAARSAGVEPTNVGVALHATRDTEGFEWLELRATHRRVHDWGSLHVTGVQNFAGRAGAAGLTETSGLGIEAGARFRPFDTIAVFATAGMRRFGSAGEMPVFIAGIAFDDLIGAPVEVRLVREPAVQRAATMLALHARAMSTRAELSSTASVAGGSLWAHGEIERIESRLGAGNRWGVSTAYDRPLVGALRATAALSAVGTDAASPSLPGWGNVFWAPERYVQATGGLRYSGVAIGPVRFGVQAATGYAFLRERTGADQRFGRDRIPVFELGADLSLMRGPLSFTGTFAYGGALDEGYRAGTLRLQASYALPR